MNERIDYQVIHHNGEAAYVLVPVEEFERIRPLLERERTDRGIPQDIVERHVLEVIPLTRAWREHLGLTQAELAERSGMKQSAIARLERGDTTPRRATLRKLADAMRIGVEQLVA